MRPGLPHARGQEGQSQRGLRWSSTTGATATCPPAGGVGGIVLHRVLSALAEATTRRQSSSEDWIRPVTALINVPV